MLNRQRIKLSILTATAIYLLSACGDPGEMMSEAPDTEPMVVGNEAGPDGVVSELEFCSAYPEELGIYVVCFDASGDVAHERITQLDGDLAQTLTGLENELGVSIIMEQPSGAGGEADELDGDDGLDDDYGDDDGDRMTGREPASEERPEEIAPRGAAPGGGAGETAEPDMPAPPPPPPPAPPPPPPPPAPMTPVSPGVSTPAPVPAPVAITQGRVAHHAPSQMVLGQPYLLEIAIQSLQKPTDTVAADASLRDAVGTGLAPDSDAPAPDLEFTTTRASEVMRASLKGNGFDITQTTETEQFLFEGEPTVWQWQVTPRQPDANLVVYSLARILKVNGEDRAQTVKTLPVSVTVRSLDDLLAEDTTLAGTINGARAAAPLPDSAPESSPAFDGSLGSPPADDAEAGAPPVLLANSGGCSTIEGVNPARHAFVLNNQAYSPPISILNQTQTDGDRLSQALVKSGFTVTRCQDLNQRATIKALSKMGRTLQARKTAGKEAVSFFYYSGHGANVSGENYILPSDLDGATPSDIRDGGVAFEDIFNRLTPVSTTSFVVFDACRTVMDDQSRGIVRSYTPVGWATGVLQAFATSPGQTAADSGVYSNVLSETMINLDDPANVVFKRVQDTVAERTGRAQVPVYTDATTGGDFFFKSPS